MGLFDGEKGKKQGRINNGCGTGRINDKLLPRESFICQLAGNGTVK